MAGHDPLQSGQARLADQCDRGDCQRAQVAVGDEWDAREGRVSSLSGTYSDYLTPRKMHKPTTGQTMSAIGNAVRARSLLKISLISSIAGGRRGNAKRHQAYDSRGHPVVHSAPLRAMCDGSPGHHLRNRRRPKPTPCNAVQPYPARPVLIAEPFHRAASAARFVSARSEVSRTRHSAEFGK